MQEHIESCVELIVSECRALVALVIEVQNRVEECIQGVSCRLGCFFGRKPVPVYQHCVTEANPRRGR